MGWKWEKGERGKSRIPCAEKPLQKAFNTRFSRTSICHAIRGEGGGVSPTPAEEPTQRLGATGRQIRRIQGLFKRATWNGAAERGGKRGRSGKGIPGTVPRSGGDGDVRTCEGCGKFVVGGMRMI